MEERPRNDLIIFCLLKLEEKGEKAEFERLLKECFDVFPKSFGLKNYPKLPDARKIDRPLRTLRKRKLISGGPASFFVLTSPGKKEAQEIARIFRQKKLF